MTGLINPARGEAVLHVDGRPLILCLTMGALTRLEAAFEVNTLEALRSPPCQFVQSRCVGDHLGPLVWRGYEPSRACQGTNSPDRSSAGHCKGV